MIPTFIGCATRNFRPGRRAGAKPEAIVIHIIVGSLRSADNTFLHPRLTQPRSAHYGVGRTGEVHQYVSETDTAFHAGVVVDPTWRLLKPGGNPNAYTIGIEHEGYADTLWPAAQQEASAELVARVASRWGIPLDADHVITHHEIRASKSCPGLGVSLLALITRSAALAPTLPSPGAPMQVRTLVAVNLRDGLPSRAAPTLEVILPGTELPVLGVQAQGEAYRGNSTWYEVRPAAYIWSGATDRPDPEERG